MPLFRDKVGITLLSPLFCLSVVYNTLNLKLTRNPFETSANFCFENSRTLLKNLRLLYIDDIFNLLSKRKKTWSKVALRIDRIFLYTFERRFLKKSVTFQPKLSGPCIDIIENILNPYFFRFSKLRLTAGIY